MGKALLVFGANDDGGTRDRVRFTVGNQLRKETETALRVHKQTAVTLSVRGLCIIPCGGRVPVAIIPIACARKQKLPCASRRIRTTRRLPPDFAALSTAEAGYWGHGSRPMLPTGQTEVCPAGAQA